MRRKMIDGSGRVANIPTLIKVIFFKRHLKASSFYSSPLMVGNFCAGSVGWTIFKKKSPFFSIIPQL